jgi:hypothetical protein
MKPLHKSDGSAVSSHANGYGKKGSGDCQANPKSWIDEEMSRGQIRHGNYRAAMLHDGLAF